MLGLYIHIPFCVSKCNYCDFVSFSNRENLKTPYINALLKEAQIYKNKKPQTLYIGGGTPSLLSARQIEILLGGLAKTFGRIKNFKESTFECNPESLTEDKLKILKDYGISRLSIGAQVLNDKHLKAIGRAHTGRQFFKAYNLAAKYFNNINIDLIAGLPMQSLSDFKKSLKEAAKLEPKHFSIYGLQVEEGTKLFDSGFKADDNLERKMLEFTLEFLSANNYIHYEISNFAKKDFESLHNINYWQSGAYIGLGLAAASYLKGVRFQNINNVKKYIANINKGFSAIEFSEKLTGKAKEGEKIILALRMLRGANLSARAQKLFEADFKQLAARSLVYIKKNNARLSEEGLYTANEVFRCFVEPF
ncbi:MAG: radical SAM family heme chaperone HemW [Elusimicrobiota bacterium]|jgi:oxygen-independent coproporphyrinogen-3 oxidase|nr:radical SAM family heme chaperone HemW [Elusimicrobiota bacterium]